MPQREGGPSEGWQSLPVACKGGLTLNVDALTQGTMMPGTAKVLQNFEPAISGGYRRISGYTKWDTNTVPGNSSAPILGVQPVFGGVIAARINSGGTSNDLFFSSGSGWGSRINTSDRGGAVTKVRMTVYSLGKLKVAGADGVNHAWTYDGTTFTNINGTSSPANPQFIAFFGASIALAGYSSNPNAVTITAPNSDTDCTAAGGAAEINVGDTITALKMFRNTLYVFCLNSIWKITGTDASTWAVQPITQEIGCIASDTVQEVGGDLIYLSPDGFRSVAGTYNIGDVDLSLQSRAIQPFIAPYIGSTDVQFSSCPVRKKSQYRCFFYDSSVDKADAVGIIGKIEQGSPLQAFNYIYTSYEWSTTLGIQAYCASSYVDGGIERVIIGDPTNGLVYQLESGEDFDGTDIVATFTTPDITFKDVALRKLLQKILVFTSLEGGSTLNLNAILDFNDTSILQPSQITLSTDISTSTYGTSVYGTGVYSTIIYPIFKNNLVGSAFTAAFQFSSTGGAPYTILSFDCVYAPKGYR